MGFESTAKAPERIGVFGGTFDPVHRAHVELARAAVSQCVLDFLVVVPCHIPSHRQVAQASVEHRLNMLRLALADEAQMQISEYELDKAETSFTVETLKYFHRQYPDVEKVFCLGADSLRSFKSWHRWEQILELANLAVMGRSEMQINGLDADMRACVLDDQEDFSQKSGQIRLLRTQEMAVSATELRVHLKEMCEDGTEADDYLRQWLHPAVLKYICEKQVYR